MMSNPLYQGVQGQNQMNGFIQKFQQFRRSFAGDPQQYIQQLMNTGKINQEQYNQAYQMAKQLMGLRG